MSDGVSPLKVNAHTKTAKGKSVVAERINTKENNAIVFAYWLIVLCGLPFWWYTTTTERLSLPNAQVRAWQAKQPCPITFSSSLHADRIYVDELSTFQQDAKGQCLEIDFTSDSADIRLFPETSPKVTEKLGVTSIGLPQDASILNLLDDFLLQPLRKANPSVVKFAPKYKLIFDLFYEDASLEASLPRMDLAGDISRHILPLLSAVNVLHEFDVEVQTQYFAPLALDLSHQENGTVLREDDLKAFVNSAQWNLASAVTTDPVLHFIAYIPVPSRRPMTVFTGSDVLQARNSFILPQFGGIVLVNPSSSSDIDSALQQSLPIFASQLARLLGLPTYSHSLLRQISDQQSRHVRNLVRSRALEAARDAVDTLSATIKLTGEISNMRVNSDVRQGIERALRSLALAEGATADSDKLKHSTQASIEASKAFFHPSMLGLLYFPQEHKYAVYTPLLGPIAIPLVAFVFREISRRRIASRHRKLDKQSKSL